MGHAGGRPGALVTIARDLVALAEGGVGIGNARLAALARSLLALLRVGGAGTSLLAPLAHLSMPPRIGSSIARFAIRSAT